MDANGHPAPAALRFADFELRLDSFELFRKDARVKLQARPAELLALLAQRTGEVVTREEIRRAVWGEGTHIDFDLALNFSIRQIRRALGDSASGPRFLSTIPRRGYRFLAPVEIAAREPTTGAAPAPAAVSGAGPGRPARHRRQILWEGAAALALILAIAVAGWRRPSAPAEPRPSAAPGRHLELPASPAATKAYLRGQYLQAEGQAEKAYYAFQETTALTPEFAPAYAARAQVLAQSGLPAKQVLAPMEVAEGRALALEPTLALAHLARAERLFYYAYDWPGAEAEFRRALDLDPQSAVAHYRLALFLAARGRHGAALTEIEQAQELDPRSLLVSSDAAWFYFLARRYSDAVEQARRTRDLLPHGGPPASSLDQAGFLWASTVTLLAERARGDDGAALAAAREVARQLAAPPPTSLADFWALEERRPTGYGWYHVMPAVALGRVDRAIDLLLQGCRERSSAMIPYLLVDPVYDPLRSNPRFPELLRCAKLV